MIDGVRHGFAGPVGDEHAVDAPHDLAAIGGGAHQQGIQQSRAPGIVQEPSPKADEPPGGNFKLQAHPPGAMIDHPGHAAPPGPEHLRDNAHELLGDIHHRQLQGLHDFAIHFLGEDLGLGQRQFKPFPAHHFDEHRQLQLSPGADLKRVPGFPGLHPDADVIEHFLVQALFNVPGGQQPSLFAAQR